MSWSSAPAGEPDGNINALVFTIANSAVIITGFIPVTKQTLYPMGTKIAATIAFVSTFVASRAISINTHIKTTGFIPEKMGLKI